MPTEALDLLKSGRKWLYVRADDVEAIIAEQRQSIERHTMLLAGARIIAFWTTKELSDDGRTTIAKIRKTSDRERLELLCPAEFVIEVAWDEWIDLNDLQRLAVVDHELCHAVYDAGESKAALLPHDLQEFRDVIGRHGLYLPDRKAMAVVMAEQLVLPGLALGDVLDMDAMADDPEPDDDGITPDVTKVVLPLTNTDPADCPEPGTVHDGSDMHVTLSFAAGESVETTLGDIERLSRQLERGARRDSDDEEPEQRAG